MLMFHPLYNEVPVTITQINSRNFVLPPLTTTAAPQGLFHEGVIMPMQKKGMLSATIGGSSERWHGIVKFPFDGQEVLCKLNIALVSLSS